jgi:hypothetical protein
MLDKLSSDTAVIERHSDRRLPEVEFKVEGIRVGHLTGQDNRRLAAVIEGTMTDPKKSLLVQNLQAKVKPAADGKFLFTVPLTGMRTYAVVVLVGHYGESHTENITIVFPAWEDFVAQLGGRAPKYWIFSAGAGFTLLEYADTRIEDYTAVVTTVKAGVTRLFRRTPWSAGANFYLTAFPITKNQDVTARFFGANARVGYTITQQASKWRGVIMGGAYYTTMFVENDAFGFRNMGGPQLFPTLQWDSGGGHMIQAYAKYSPVSELAGGFRLRPGVDREIAGGLGYVTPRWSATIDVAHLSLLIRGVEISSFSLTLGGAVNF